jgi:hypothetical protein
MSRYHKDLSDGCLQKHYAVSGDDASSSAIDLQDTALSSTVDANSDSDGEGQFDITAAESPSPANFEKALLDKTALLSLKLQVKHHVPSTAEPTVLSELCYLLNHYMSAVTLAVSDILSDNNVPEDLLGHVTKAIQSYPLCGTLDPKNGPLHSKAAQSWHYK